MLTMRTCLFSALLFFGLLVPTAFAQRMHDSHGLMVGRIDGVRLYDGSGRQIGRADGPRRLQMLVFFYFFMRGSPHDRA